MTRIVFFIGLCLLFLSCKKEEAQDSGCLSGASTSYYLSFWKNEFLKRNSTSEEWFDAHVSRVKTSAVCWNSGITFRVDYMVSIGWAEILDHSDFLVQLNAGEPAYQHLAIPRDRLLDSAQLQIVLDNDVASSSIGPVTPYTTLKYGSHDAALRALQDSTGYGSIKAQPLMYYVPGKLPRKDGDPYMLGFGHINASLNQCVYGYLNLVTGASYADTTACIVE